MNQLDKHEFLCPHCGFIDSIPHKALGDKYREFSATCKQCKQPIEVIAADGVGDTINLVVSVPFEKEAR